MSLRGSLTINAFDAGTEKLIRPEFVWLRAALSILLVAVAVVMAMSVPKGPTIDEVADQLGEDVLPFVLLLDADEEYGFTRAWQPRQSGASTHYGYAVQWFAMAAAVLAILAWHFRHGIRNRE